MEQNNQESTLFDLSINETAKDHLRKTATWAIVIVITALISYVLSIVNALQVKHQVVEYEGFPTSVAKGPTLAGAIVGIVIGLVINYFLFQFANLTKKGVNEMNQSELNQCLSHLKIYFAIVGILVILALVFALLGGLLFSSFSPGR